MSISLKSGKKHIILHVGLHKTGTTSIQDTLFHNHHLLERNGFFYPKCWPANHSFPVYSSFCNRPEEYRQNIYAQADPKKIIDTNKRHLFNLKQAYQEHFNDHLIISGEDISNLTQKNLTSLKQYFEWVAQDSMIFRILIYLRDPVTLAVSLTQEWIKGGFNFNQSLLNAKKEIHDQHQNKISKFQNVFGRENVHVYAYESTLSESNSPVVHFLKTLGFTNKAIEQFHIIKSNPTISQPCADIVSYINEAIPMFINHRLNPERNIDDCKSLFLINGPKFNLSNAEKEAIYQLEKDDLLWLMKNHQINYLRTMPIKEKNEEYLYTPALCEGIKTAFLNSNGTIRKLMIDYFRNKTTTEKFLQIRKDPFINQLENRALIKAFKNQIPKKTNWIKKTRFFIRSVWLLKKSELFDSAYYLNHSPDVHKNAVIHYLTHGVKENKNPSKHFCTEYYLRNNHDVLESGINPLVHYILFGKEEGREKESVMDHIHFILCNTKGDKANGLFTKLIEHPEIEMPLEALRFFNNDEFFTSQKIHYNDYHKHFCRSKHTKVLGESCNSYLYSEKAIERIHRYNPQMKWIINFEYLTALEYNRTLESLKKRLCLFPDQQICLIEHHLLKNSPESVIRNICHFLGIDHWFVGIESRTPGFESDTQ